MNMHGIMAPAEIRTRHRESTATIALAWLRARRMILLIVVLPTLLLAGYLFLFAADQYESEAHYLVRSAQGGEVVSSGMSQALSFVTGGGGGEQNQSASVADYLTSHDAVAALRGNDQLVERFTRTEADFFSRLSSRNPTPEKLLKFYRKQVDVKFAPETGITTLKVRSFEPKDSYQLVRRLLELGEQRVNILNSRSYQDSIAMASKQLTDSENQLAAVQGRLTSFRQTRRDIDPQMSGQAQISLVSTLSAQLAAARAQLNGMGSMIDHSSPQYRAIASRVQALEAQVSAQSGRLTGGSGAIAADISGFEGLRLRQQFLAKRYEAAAASLDRARDTAIRQQLYLVRVVDANMPVKALYPERWRILLTTLIVLLVVYSIGWLIVAGVREHAA